MADFTGLIEAMKRASLDAVKADRPMSVMFGRVIGTDPLQINVEQKMTLEGPQLILSRNVTDYTVEMTIEHSTEPETGHVHEIRDTYTGGGTSLPTQHTHGYKGRKGFTVHNALVTGDTVILIQEQGGQRFIVIDRLG